MKHKGILSFTDNDGKPQFFEMTLPIEIYADTMAWGLDMLRKIQEHSRFRRWLLRILLGRYAYREMQGLRDSLIKHGDWIDRFGYGLEQVEYHKIKSDPI